MRKSGQEAQGRIFMEQHTPFATTMISYPTSQYDIIHALRLLFCAQPGVVEELRHYGTKRRFPNGMRCDLLCVGQKHPVLRVSRGAWMIRQEPYLSGLFDVNARVISKIIIRDTQTIVDKALPQLISKIANLPDGIGVLQ